MQKRTKSKLFSIAVTGKMVIELLKKAAAEIPEDAILIKVISTNDPSYAFDFIFHSKEQKRELFEPARGKEGKIVTSWS